MLAVAYLDLILLGVPSGDQQATVEAAFGGPSLAVPMGWPPLALHFLHGTGVGILAGLFLALAVRWVSLDWTAALGAGGALGIVLWVAVVIAGGPPPPGAGARFYLIPIGLSMHLELGLVLGVALMLGSKRLATLYAAESLR